MRLKSREFKDFIHKSKLKLENSLWRVEAVFHPGFGKKQESLAAKVIKVLIDLTSEGKIIWSKEEISGYKGIIMGHQHYSGFKFVIRNNKEIYSLYVFQKENKLVEKYSSNIKNNDPLQHLIEIVNQKINLEQN